MAHGVVIKDVNWSKRQPIIEYFETQWPKLGHDRRNYLLHDYNSIRARAIDALKNNAVPRNITVAVANKKIQGVVIHGKQEGNWYVDYLISAPWNVQKTAQRCHGAGTALMQHVAETAKKTGAGKVELYPTISGEGFYTKIGYVKEKGRRVLKFETTCGRIWKAICEFFTACRCCRG